MLQPKNFDPRQQMASSAYELQYKRDTYLKSVELHHHDFYEIFFLLSGDVTYTIESKLCRVLPGDILMISPRELHQVLIKPDMEPYERYVLWVSPETIARLSTPATNLSLCLDPVSSGYRNQLRPDPEHQQLMLRLLQSLHRETQIESYGSDLLRTSLLTQILITINRLASREHSFLDDAIRTNAHVSQAIAYINRHYDEPISLEQLADHFFVSKSHLSHEFQRLVGTSVYRYIQKKRLLIARQLLSSGKKPNKVYSLCGFGDYTGFYRAFKAEYGISPREYASQAGDHSALLNCK